MSDSEKIELISKMVVDFWEFNEAEDMRNGAVTMVTTISTVVDFKGDEH